MASSPLFDAMASRQSSPAASSAAPQQRDEPRQSPSQLGSNTISLLNYPADQKWPHRGGSTAAAEEPSSSDTGPGPPVGSSFAAAVRRKEWRMAGPPSAPSFGEEPAGFSGGSGTQNRQWQRAGGGGLGGPLADSVASLTMSADRPPGRQTYSHAPGEIFGALQPIVDEEAAGPSEAAKKGLEGAGLSPSVARRRSSGNPFKDEGCSTPPNRSSAERSGSGNPFAVADGGDVQGRPGPSDGAQLHLDNSREAEVHWPCAQLDPAFLQLSPKPLAA